MKSRFLIIASLPALLLAGGATLAQGPASGPPANPGQVASPMRQGYGAGYHARQMAAANRPASAAQEPGAPGAGMGPGMGMGRGAGMGRGRAGMAGADFTPGWSLMTPAERTEHRSRIAASRSYEECVSTMTQHRDQMVARATERGVPAPTPRRDACASLKP